MGLHGRKEVLRMYGGFRVEEIIWRFNTSPSVWHVHCYLGSNLCSR